MKAGTSSRFSLEVFSGELESSGKDEWNAFVAQTPEGTFFHRYEWLHLNAICLNAPAIIIQVRRKDRLIGGFPCFVQRPWKTPLLCIDSLPMGFGGPILHRTNERRKVLDLMFDELDRLAVKHRAHLIQIRTTGISHLAYCCFLDSRGFSPVVRNCSFGIDICRPFSEAVSNFAPSTRRNLRKAEVSGLCVEECEPSVTWIGDFYDLYRKTMKRKGGVVRPKRLFESIPSSLGDNALLISGMHPEVQSPIAAMIHLLCHDSRTIYYFWGVSDPRFRSMRPNELLHAWTIRWGADRGFARYDLGGTNADFELGLYRFKRNLGGIPFANVFWLRSQTRWAFSFYQWGRRLYHILRKLQRQ